MNVESIDGALGASIRGVDIARGIDAGEMTALTQALYDHHLIVLREQQLDKDAYLAFGRLWGEPIPHVLDHMRMPGYPEMMVVGNTETKDRTDHIRNGAALWHTDQSYERVPASATMLYSLKNPRVGGQTQFCNMAAAYDGLDANVKARIDGLLMAHKYGKGKRGPGELVVNPLLNDDQDRRVPAIYHPLVMAHPITGRKALYALGHGAHAIKGMPDAQAESLIDELREHALQEKYIYRHRYAVGDIAVWDTLATMHCATPIDVPADAAEERILWRISVRGKPRVYQ